MIRYQCHLFEEDRLSVFVDGHAMTFETMESGIYSAACLSRESVAALVGQLTAWLEATKPDLLKSSDMKIWQLVGDGKYAGGVAIVAAGNVERAVDLANSDPNRHSDIWFVSDRAKELDKIVQFINAEEVILSFGYAE